MNTTIAVTRATVRKPKPVDSELRFGTVFTDHMARMTYAVGEGWSEACIVPYGPLSLDPAA